MAHNGKLAILVGGGPAPGINSVIAAATIRARLSDVEVIGIQDGFRYLMEGNTEHVGPLGIDTSGIRDTRPEIQSGSDWLDEQSEATQRAILGNKYDGWSNGDFSLEDIVGHTHDDDWGHSIYEKSLKQLSKG